MHTPLGRLIEPSELALHLDDKQLIIVDVSSPDNYRNGHVPGAIHLPPGALMRGKPPVPGKLPELEDLNDLFSYLGLSPDKHVVAYDDEGGGWAGRLLWTLDVIGHHQWSYLDGGIHAWRDDGLQLCTEIARPEQTDYHCQLHPGPLAELEDVLASLGQPDSIVWDARSREEYLGLRSPALRHGHIPGAAHLDWLDLMDRNRSLRLKPLEEIRATLAGLGISADKTIYTHCQSHHRSGLSYLVGQLLGLNIKAYHGSWGEWGNREDTPIKQGAEP